MMKLKLTGALERNVRTALHLLCAAKMPDAQPGLSARRFSLGFKFLCKPHNAASAVCEQVGGMPDTPERGVSHLHLPVSCLGRCHHG